MSKSNDKLSGGEAVLSDALLERLARWIVQHPPQYGGDHACRECYPHSDMLKDGFVCAYHEAVKIAERSNAAGSSAPACSPTDLEVLHRREKMWRDECVRIVNALADLAGLPRDPCPGWQPCVEKIKAMMANEKAEVAK